MSWIAASMQRPVTVSMGVLAVVLFGALAFTRLGVNLLPELTYPTLTVRSQQEGSAPLDIEDQLTRPIEERLGVVPGLVKMHSVSTVGQSDVILEFAWGTNMDLAAIEVREKLDLVRLPLDVERPAILRLNPNLDPILRWALARNSSPLAEDVTASKAPIESSRQATANQQPSSREVAALQGLRTYAEETLKRQLDPIPGLAAVTLSGGYEDEILILMDQERMAQVEITPTLIADRLRSANVNLSAGRLTDGGQEYLVRTLNEFQTIEEIERTIIGTVKTTPLRVEDVAEVQQSFRERESITRVNGQEAIELSLYKEGDANTVEVAQAAADKLAELRAALPEHYELVELQDQSRFIRSAIDSALDSAWQGALLAVVVLWLFLRDLRSTFVIALTIPISVMATFVMMRMLSIDLNIMSLGGIALAVGMLVDNAIVVLENIARLRQEGRTPWEAVREGAIQVAAAVSASTLTTVAVFVPLVFVEGIAGQLFRDQAMTVTFALLASLVLSFTLVPMLMSLALPNPRSAEEVRLVVPPAGWFDRAFGRLSAAYVSLLALALRHRGLTLATAALLLGVSLQQLMRLPAELIPPLVQGEFAAKVEFAAKTPLEQSDRYLDSLAQRLREQAGVAQTFALAGTGGQLDAAAETVGEHRARLSVLMSGSATTAEEVNAMQRLRAWLAEMPDTRATVDWPNRFTFTTPLEVEVAGFDLTDIGDVARVLQAKMTGDSGLTGVEGTLKLGYPEVRLFFDQERLASLGLSAPEIARQIVGKLRGDVPTEYTLNDRTIDIRVRDLEAARDSMADLEALLINPASDRPVRLASVARIETGMGPADIQRIGQQRVAVLRASPVDGDLEGASRRVAQMIDDIPRPSGVTVRIAGQQKEMERSFASLSFALLLAALLIYLVMASLFESLLHPLIIMISLPLAVIGAVAALTVTNTAVSVVVLIGAVLLAGIVVNNAIVLIDRVNGLTAQGFERREALRLAVRQRIRPIMMTTLTTLLGLLPMAIGWGDGGELRAPLAITVMGGLAVATLLTLIVIPVMYDLAESARGSKPVLSGGAESVGDS